MKELKEHIVISVGCEYACGGSAIGRLMARDLGIAYYDRYIIDRIMEETGVSPALLELADKGVDISGLRAGDGYANAPTKYTDLTDRMVYIQKEIVRKLADRSSCVIIGRCSDYILRRRTDCLRVYIYGPTDYRMNNVMKELHVDARKAERILRENDENLMARYRQITGTDWGERHHRQLLIDSSVLGIEGTARYIEGFVEDFYGKLYPESASGGQRIEITDGNRGAEEADLQLHSEGAGLQPHSDGDNLQSHSASTDRTTFVATAAGKEV